MENIIKLTKMSLNNLTAGAKNLGFIIAIWMVVSIISPSFLSILFGMGGYLFIHQVMSYEDMHGIDNLISTLPVKRSEYVISRYVLGISVSLIVTIVLSLIYIIINMVNKIDIPLKLLLLTALISSVVAISFIIPIIIKFGTNKGKIVTFLVLMVIMSIPMGVMQLTREDVDFIDGIVNTVNNIGIPIIAFLSSLILIVLSMITSLKLYSNKEVK